MYPPNLLLFGASVRAAAFSALRAGLRPWCADLFGDQDLRARCHVVQVPAPAYPDAFRDMIEQSVPGPWAYTGALENFPNLLGKMARGRALWGNAGQALRCVRNPFLL